MSKYGEPWKIVQSNNTAHGYVGSTKGSVADFSSADEARRAVECVNAMTRLDPVKVREYLEDAASRRCMNVGFRIQQLMGAECGKCLTCRARACVLDEKGEEDA